jgi:hypothetical protein
MHASESVHRFIEQQLPGIHAARRRLLGVAVLAAMAGAWIGLSRLARGLVGGSNLKAAIKRVERLISNNRIADEAQQVAEVLLARLCRLQSPLVVAVDWSAVAPGGEFVELRAAVTCPGMGRGQTVYQRVYPMQQLGDNEAERALLHCLHGWIPKGVPVIVITDAGFRRPWFLEIKRLEWSFIGRVRRGVNLAYGDDWETVATWFKRATGKAKRWLDCALTRGAPFVCDVVLCRRRPKPRPEYRCPGHGSTYKTDREARQSAHEPWLLVHSEDLRKKYRADEIVAFYARRMQIEENFRDSKSVIYGLGQSIGRSRSASRLHGLLLVATLATFFLWHIGQLAETEGLHRRYKATTRTTRELSLIALALLLCALPQLPITPLAAQTLERRLGIR